MPVIYNSDKIIPAPFASITKTYVKNGANENIGTTFDINLIGTILPDMGSPTSTQTFWDQSGYPPNESHTSDQKLASILRKQEALRELFSVEGLLLEIQPLDGSESMRCNPRVISLNFTEGTWVTRCDYTIQLQCDVMYPEQEDVFDQLISDAQENWQIENDSVAESDVQQSVYRISHTVSAVGKRFYDSIGNLNTQPWQQAQTYVLSKLGFDSQIALSSGVHNLPSYYGGFNQTRTSNTDKGAGSFSATETWILASGAALEDFTIDVQSNNNDPLKHVTINGTITGLEQRDTNYNITTTKYQNAQSKFVIASGQALARAQTYSGYTMNIVPLSTTIGRNPVIGTISYSFDYNDRPSNIVSGALSEVISLNDSLMTDLVAIIPVLGRAAGPVLQRLGSSDPTTRQLSIELVMPVASFNNNSMADIQAAFFAQKPTTQVSGIINALNPINNGWTESYVTSDNESWEPKQGRYSRNVSWIYQ